MIEKARAVREAVLAIEDGVEWTKGVIDGVEHSCWRIPGDGWHATITNLWDFHVATCQATGRPPNERDNVIHHELLEVYCGDDELVMSMINEIGGDYEQLYDFCNDGWEQLILSKSEGNDRDDYKASGSPQFNNFEAQANIVYTS